MSSNIVRCILPDGVHRFKLFSVEDYRDFLLVRADIVNKPKQEQIQILDELIEEYFPEVLKIYRPYVFLKVFTSSIGKTRIPISFECPKCKKKKKTLFNMQLKDLVNPIIETAGLKIKFRFPDSAQDDLVKLVKDNITSVISEEIEYPWSDLDDQTKLDVINAISYEVFEDIVKSLKPIYLTLNTSCCDKQFITYTDIIDIFNLLIHPDEIFTFYQINHILVKNSYDLSSIMKMVPIERGVALSLIEKDLTK